MILFHTFFVFGAENNFRTIPTFYYCSEHKMLQNSELRPIYLTDLQGVNQSCKDLKTLFLAAE